MNAIEKMTDLAPGQRVEWRNDDEISTGTLVELAHERGGITEPFPAWSDAYACAEAAVALDGGT